MIGDFRSVFFVAEKPLSMTRTCTVVNFHNLHGQFGIFLFLNRRNQVTSVCGKNGFLREIQRKIEDFS